MKKWLLDFFNPPPGSPTPAIFPALPAVKVVDPPKPVAVRDLVLGFARGRADGFIDEDMYGLFTGATPAQLRTRRKELEHEGLIVRRDRRPNAAGVRCQVFLHVEFTAHPAQPKPKRLTYSQIKRRLKTAELELEMARKTVAAYESALRPSGESKAFHSGEYSIRFPEFDEDGNEHMRQIHVPWDAIKNIMAGIREHTRQISKQKENV